MATTLLPKAGTEYSVRLGRSFAAETADAASVAAFHYRFLPASAEDAAEGRLEKKGRGGRTRLALRMAASGDTHEFHGTTHAAKEGECVLIFDLDAQTATLERLSTIVSDLAPATATTTATAPPPPPPPQQQQQQQPPAAKRQKQQPRQQTLTPTIASAAAAAAAPQQQQSQQSQQHTPITPTGDSVVDEVAAMIERDAQLPPLTPTSAASVPLATAGAIKMALASLNQQQQLLKDAADNSDFDSSDSSSDEDSSDSDA